MFFKIRTLGLSLVCGGLGLLVACEPVTPPKTPAVWDEANTTIEFGVKTDDQGNPVYVSEGFTGYFTGASWPDAIIKVHAALENFTIRETTPPSHDSPPPLDADYTDTYDPGCYDTWTATEDLFGAAFFFDFYQPLWSPYSCPGPETGGPEDWDAWNKAGHIQVFFNGIYVGSGYSNDFELEILRQPLFWTPDFGSWVVDHNGIIQEWVDKNGDGMVDVGADLDLDGRIGTAADVEPDLDGDGYFDQFEPDTDLDGRCDTIEEDQDGDGNLDVNEDSPTNGGNGDGIPGIVISVDLDGDGTPEDYVGGTVITYDATWREWSTEYYPSFASEDINGNGLLDENEVDLNGCWTDLNGDGLIQQVMIDLDGDYVPDIFTEDFNGNGMLDDGPDPDIDGDGRIDMPDYDGDGVVEDSEDWNGDGTLDVDEDLNGDGHCTFEYDGQDVNQDGVIDNGIDDLDNDGYWDTEDESAVTLQCSDKPFGCEGDDVLLVVSGDYLFGLAQWYDAFYTADTQWEDICTEGLDQQPISRITLKLVHDDHSDIYGAPFFNYDLTLKDMMDMGIVTCAPTQSGVDPEWMVEQNIYKCETLFGGLYGLYTYYEESDVPEEYR